LEKSDGAYKRNPQAAKTQGNPILRKKTLKIAPET
jgi:hypothetical protein